MHWLTAVQAQDYPGATVSVALRTKERTKAGVAEALDRGAVVRSWPMRGTLHFVAAEDLPWMLSLTAERMLAATARRRADLDITDADLEHARKVAVAVLGGGRRLGRAGLFAEWQRAGQRTDAQRRAHLFGHLAMSGLLCLGPTIGREQAVVLCDEWITAPRRPERDEALGEWALRYFRGHGPATVKDFAWWTKLRAAEVKTAVAVAKPHLEPVEADGIEYLMDPRTPSLLDAHRAEARGVYLLPGFDEYLLGYGDRGPALPAEFAERVVPGRNGMFLSTVVSGGQVVGTWRRTGSGAARSIDATPFAAFTARVGKAIPRLYTALP